jgi:hypothetical protein
VFGVLIELHLQAAALIKLHHRAAVLIEVHLRDRDEDVPQSCGETEGSSRTDILKI